MRTVTAKGGTMSRQTSACGKLLIVLCAALLYITTHSGLAQTPPPASGRDPRDTQQIIPADVLARVKLLNEELAQIAKALGKPKAATPLIQVANASPREVYFEAQALFEKSNRLAYEVEGSHEDTPEQPSEQIVPAHVWQLVDASLQRIQTVRKKLGLHHAYKENIEPNNTTPTNVFNAILQSNQQLNTLLNQQVAPSDVFEQVTLAINGTEQLLKKFNVTDRIPDAPNFELNKTPSNVYKRLTQCVQLLQEIAKKSGINMLSIDKSNLNSRLATPNDVFDLTKIIVAQIHYLEALLPGIEKIESYYPGYKTPSDVFQRAGILLKQLELLNSEVTKNPSWLKSYSQGAAS